jgi:hypothetical protein
MKQILTKFVLLVVSLGYSQIRAKFVPYLIPESPYVNPLQSSQNSL